MKIPRVYRDFIHYKTDSKLSGMKRELSLDKLDGKDTSELEEDIKAYERLLEKQNRNGTHDTGPK